LKLSLSFARVVWIILVMLNIGVYVLGSILHYQDLETICNGSRLECHDLDLVTPEDVPQLQADGLTLREWAIWNTGYRTIYALIFWGVAFLIFARKHDEWNGLLISFILFSFGTISASQQALLAHYPAIGPIAKILSVLGYAMFPLFFATFPNGRVIPRVMWIPVILWSLYFMNEEFFKLIPRSSTTWEVVAAVGWFSMFTSGAAAQIYRYKHASNEQERRQTKWVVFGIGTLVTCIFILYVTPLGRQLEPTITFSLNSLILLTITNLLFTIIPITIGIAILRYRLFDIDLIIRRTLLYSVLTLTLALAYFGSVVALQNLFTIVFKVDPGNFALVLSTLMIAALFTPLRHRIQEAIDRRFYRQKYDAEQVLAALGTTLRDEVDLDHVTKSILGVVEETMQPAQVSLWLRNTGVSEKDESVTNSRVTT